MWLCGVLGVKPGICTQGRAQHPPAKSLAVMVINPGSLVHVTEIGTFCVPIDACQGMPILALGDV